MFSIPPANTIAASPSKILCAPCVIASIPDPHSRFTVTAGVSTFNPAFNPTCRAPYKRIRARLHRISQKSRVIENPPRIHSRSTTF